MSKIDLRSERLFPWYFQLAGALLLLTGAYYFIGNPALGLALIFISLLIFTSFSGIEIAPNNKTYRPYYSFLFIKTGKRRSYEEIENIYINANNVRQHVYTPHTNNSTVFENTDFDAYIKFNNGVKEYLLSKRDKNDLIKKLEGIAHTLDTSLVDNTKS